MFDNYNEPLLFIFERKVYDHQYVMTSCLKSY